MDHPNSPMGILQRERRIRNAWRCNPDYKKVAYENLKLRIYNNACAGIDTTYFYRSIPVDKNTYIFDIDIL